MQTLHPDMACYIVGCTYEATHTCMHEKIMATHSDLF